MAKTGMHSLMGATLSTPGLVTLIGYAILMVLVLLPVNMQTYNEKTGEYVQQPYSFTSRLLIVLLLLFPFLLSVYSVNCMVVGDCNLWSWVVALLTLLWAVVVAVGSFSVGSFKLDQLA